MTYIIFIYRHFQIINHIAADFLKNLPRPQLLNSQNICMNEYEYEFSLLFIYPHLQSSSWTWYILVWR